MISLLMPTRKRLDHFIRSVDSIIANASNKDNYELIIGLDDDDTDTIAGTVEYLKNKNINSKIIYFYRMYYKNFHRYTLALFNNCSGELVWTFPDDCEILSKNWDEILLNNKNHLYLKVNMADDSNWWDFSIVPVISEKWVKKTQRIAENSQTDIWLGKIASDLQIVQRVPEVICNIFAEPNIPLHNITGFNSEESQKCLEEDKLKIKELMKEIKYRT